MKHVKLLTAITTTCLAATGVIAAKSASFHESPFYYITSIASGTVSPVCVKSPVDELWEYSPTGTTFLYQTAGGNYIPAFYDDTCKTIFRHQHVL